jgi:hypothetical protein
LTPLKKGGKYFKVIPQKDRVRSNSKDFKLIVAGVLFSLLLKKMELEVIGSVGY